MKNPIIKITHKEYIKQKRFDIAHRCNSVDCQSRQFFDYFFSYGQKKLKQRMIELGYAKDDWWKKNIETNVYVSNKIWNALAHFDVLTINLGDIHYHPINLIGVPCKFKDLNEVGKTTDGVEFFVKYEIIEKRLFGLFGKVNIIYIT